MDTESVVHIYDRMLLSSKKEHIWVSPNEVDEPRAYCTEWSKSERETQILYTHACVWTAVRWCWSTVCRAAVETQTQRTVSGHSVGGRGWVNAESSMGTHTHVTQIATGSLLHHTASATQCSVTTERGGMGWEMGGSFKTGETYVYLRLLHVDEQQKPVQYYKANISR